MSPSRYGALGTYEPQQMTSTEFTRGLTEPLSYVGPCHCRPEQLSHKNVLHPGGTQHKPGCCILCRCDEHTPETHGQDPSPVSPGCGRLCTLRADYRIAVASYVGAAGTDGPDWEPETEAGKRSWGRYLDWMAERHPQETEQSTPRRSRKGAQS